MQKNKECWERRNSLCQGMAHQLVITNGQSYIFTYMSHCIYRATMSRNIYVYMCTYKYVYMYITKINVRICHEFESGKEGGYGRL